MQTKHTPGPWHVTEARGTRGQFCYWHVEPTLPDHIPYRGEVANVHEAEHISGITVDECAANARLIASAPDLLKALNALCNYVCDDLENNAPNWKPLDIPEYAQARAAIARATEEA